MNVKQLIRFLETFDPEAEIQLAKGYDSSNYPMDEWDIDYDEVRRKVFIG